MLGASATRPGLGLQHFCCSQVSSEADIWELPVLDKVDEQFPLWEVIQNVPVIQNVSSNDLVWFISWSICLELRQPKHELCWGGIHHTHQPHLVAPAVFGRSSCGGFLSLAPQHPAVFIDCPLAIEQLLLSLAL